jgi:hypothetical protein
MADEKKEKIGRPWIGKSGPGIRAFTVLSPEAHEAIKKLAKEDDRTLAAYLRKIALAHLREKGFEIFQ